MVEKKGKKKTKKKSKKKTAKKKTAKKNTAKSSEAKIMQGFSKREEILISNFVALQRVITNLSMKMDDMSSKLAKLLDVFEISAKALAEKNFEFSPKKNDEEMIKKIDTLSEQNKIIARGLTLLHEKSGEEEMYNPQTMLQQRIPSQPMQPPRPTISGQGFQPSQNKIPLQNTEIPKPNFSIPSPKPLPKNTDLNSATQGYKSSTLGENADIEKPLPPTEENQSQ